MTYGEFLEYVSSKCLHETIYDDSDGHPILVIRLLDAYGMVNKLQRPWVELTFAEICDAEVVATDGFNNFSELKFARAIEAKLKELNT
jgi:hypothetical protein